MPDHKHYITKVLNGEKVGNKIHIMDCTTLKQMREAGKGERYSAINGDREKFPVKGERDDGTLVENKEVSLVVCKHCLNGLNYKGYNSRSKQVSIFKNFKLKDFFNTYSSYFKHAPVGADVRRDGYTKDWADISKAFRKSKNWICQKCKIELSDHHKLLHTHHINMKKTDNDEVNFKALCCVCHSKEKHHERLYISHDDRLLINKIRRDQNKKTEGYDSWEHVFEEADPAVHGLLEKLKDSDRAIPEVGADLINPESMLIIAQAELVWRTPGEFGKAIVLQISDSKKIELEKIGWTIKTAKEELDALIK